MGENHENPSENFIVRKIRKTFSFDSFDQIPFLSPRESLTKNAEASEESSVRNGKKKSDTRKKNDARTRSFSANDKMEDLNLKFPYSGLMPISHCSTKHHRAVYACVSHFSILVVAQPPITCSKLTIETLEQGVKYVQS